MTIEPTQDYQLVIDTITSDEIWDLAAGDGMEKELFIPRIDPFSMWLLAKTDKICGIILVEIENAAAIRIHPYSYDKGKWFYMMKAFFRWFMENSSEQLQKINAKTPVYNSGARKLLLKLGFKDEGTDRLSFLKNGELFDQYILGITKDEVRGQIKWQQQSL